MELTRAEHVAQAERLLEKADEYWNFHRSNHWLNDANRRLEALAMRNSCLAAAQVHATLAQIPDGEVLPTLAQIPDGTI